MLDALISSKTRIKLLLKFFLNSSTKAHLRGLESEFGESSNAVRLELNRFEEAGLLTSASEGNKKLFQANTEHPLFREIHSILLKTFGLDSIIETVIKRLGEVQQVWLTGDLAKGMDTPIIDLIFVGNIDRVYLLNLTEKAEKIISRKIRYVIYSEAEFNSQKTMSPQPFLLWSAEALVA